MYKKAPMLTTLDNPYSPYTQFQEWDRYDRQMGYNTLAYQARVTVWSDDLSEGEQNRAISEAISEILDLNILGIYMIAPEPVK